MELSYSITGSRDAPPLLLVNSIGATRDILWSRQVPFLSRSFRVITYDPRGHGQSPVPPGDYSLDDLGRDAIGVLDAAGVTEAHVCGVSMGGITAMWLGIHAPERVEKLALLCTSPRMGPPEMWAERIVTVPKAA